MSQFIRILAKLKLKEQPTLKGYLLRKWGAYSENRSRKCWGKCLRKHYQQM